jgi:hypothetical protein
VACGEVILHPKILAAIIEDASLAETDLEG